VHIYVVNCEILCCKNYHIRQFIDFLSLFCEVFQIILLTPHQKTFSLSNTRTPICCGNRAIFNLMSFQFFSLNFLQSKIFFHFHFYFTFYGCLCKFSKVIWQRMAITNRIEKSWNDCQYLLDKSTWWEWIRERKSRRRWENFGNEIKKTMLSKCLWCSLIYILWGRF
jgi:hypothetical protein